jgi:hypothetical protein
MQPSYRYQFETKLNFVPIAVTFLSVAVNSQASHLYDIDSSSSLSTIIASATRALHHYFYVPYAIIEFLRHFRISSGKANNNDMTEEQKIHFEKALKDWAEEQMKDAGELCIKIMERTKQHIYEFQNAPGPIDIVEFLRNSLFIWFRPHLHPLTLVVFR